MTFNQFNLLLLVSSILSVCAAESEGVADKAALPAKPDYLLAYQDKLTVSIVEDPVAGEPIRLVVTASGEIDVPISRCCEGTVSIQAAGKSLKEIETELKTKLEQDYYEKATISLRLIDRNPRLGQVLLNGSVRGTTYNLNPARPKTVWEVLTEVGTTQFANLSKVEVQRKDPKTGQIQKHTVDVEAVGKGQNQKDLELQDGDRIIVPEKKFNLF